MSTQEVADSNKSPISGTLNYLLHLGQAKRTYRTGWVLRGVKEAESIADHMYRMAMISFILPPSAHLDRSKCIEMCLIHDLAECIVGDLTPSDNVSKEEKTKLEDSAIAKICELIGAENETTSEHLATLYREYSSHASAEAKYVKSLDLLDMFVQAYEYERLQPELDLTEFFSQASKHEFEPSLRKLVDELIEIREKKLNALPANSNLNTILKFHLKQ